MPAFSKHATVLIRHQGATLVTAAERAQDIARALRAKAQQTIIDSECRATKLALIQDKEAWRVYRRQLGLRRADFVPYLT
jgi:hypothetical protein